MLLASREVFELASTVLSGVQGSPVRPASAAVPDLLAALGYGPPTLMPRR